MVNHERLQRDQHERVQFIYEPVFTVLGDDATDAAIQIFTGGQRRQEFRIDTDEAVQPAYILEAEQKLKALPTFGSELGFERINPLNLLAPKALQTVDYWLHEQGIHIYNDARARASHEQKFILTMQAWNHYHVAFLRVLNIPDPDVRFQTMLELNQKIFGTRELGFTPREKFKDIAPYENPYQWLAYNMYNVLVSPESDITPVARYRAVELASRVPIDELKNQFFGTEREYNRGQFSPSYEITIPLREKYMRLPRKFWETTEERTNPIHNGWESNSHVLKIMNPKKPPRGWPTTYDYGQIFNALVTSNQREAIHIALLMHTSYTQGHTEAAFEGLLAMARLDPITIQSLFGDGASYLTMHQMPQDVRDQVQESLGLEVFDQDLAFDMKGLTGEQYQQVIRRLQRRIVEQDLIRAELERSNAAMYFQHAKVNEMKQLDPSGYWQLLGVNPYADPNDLDDLIKRAYRLLATKYHPDGTEPDEKRMKDINVAYGILGDPEKRKRYGRMRRK